MGKDDMGQAAWDGNIEELNQIIKRGHDTPDSRKAANALLLACEVNEVETAKVLLDWGVSVDCTDDAKRKPLQLAALKGYVELTKLLCSRDPEQVHAALQAKDGEGNQALSVAVMKKMLPVCKVLLKAGAVLKPGQTCAGLATVVREVQLENLMDELKGYNSQHTSDDIARDLEAADETVWAAQTHHMKLLALREEHKAGSQVRELQRQLENETDIYTRSAASEEALAKELEDLRVTLTSVQTAYSLTRQQLDTAEFAQREAEEEEMVADREYKAMLGDLTRAQQEQAEYDKAYASKEKARNEALDLGKELADELAAMKITQREVNDELKVESAELRGWQRDQEAAAALTAQAQQMLGQKSPKRGAASPKKSPADAGK